MRSSIVSYSLLGIATAYLALIGSACGAASDDESDAELARLSELFKTSLNETGDKWICKPKQLQICDVEGCSAKETETEARLDFLQKTYSRCDQKGCDSYPMTFEASGIFTVAQPNSRSTFLKVLNDGSEYMEVVTSHLGAWVYVGSCEAAD